MRLGILPIRSFIVSIPSAIDVASGVLLFFAALDEGSAFESGRRPGTMLKSVDVEPGLMGASKTLGTVLFAGVCDDEDIFLRDEEPLVSSGGVGGETGALGVGVLCVCAILDL